MTTENPTEQEIQDEIAKSLRYLDEKTSEAGSTVVTTYSTTIDSASMSFSLPNPFLSLLVFADGILLRSGTDYTVSNQTVTLTSDWAVGTELNFEMVTQGKRILHEVEVASASNTFELPNPPSSLSVYMDGMLCQFGTGYTFANQTVTFADSIPVGTILSFVINM